jgi:hypothetical protein
MESGNGDRQRGLNIRACSGIPDATERCPLGILDFTQAMWSQTTDHIEGRFMFALSRRGTVAMTCPGRIIKRRRAPERIIAAFHPGKRLDELLRI